MIVRVLGPLEVEGPDGAVSVGGPVPRRLLCALLVSPGAVVPVDALVEAAWGEAPPSSAERTLVSHLTRLREALATGLGDVQLERRDAGYRVLLDRQLVDAVRFERLVADAAEQPGPQRVEALTTALGLWREPGPFAELRDTGFPAAEAARLTELRGAAVESLTAAHLDAADPVAAVALAESQLAVDPFRERLWELLILGLYRQGRQGDALAAYQRARAALSDELGIDPGPRLQDLERKVLAQDGSLLASTGAVRHPCPYKGLARYDSTDAGLFVGRERLVEELVARLVDEQLLVVVGPSGAGKSSLVRAGLVPALAAGALPGSAGWSVTTIVPGTDPVTALQDASAEAPTVLVVDQAEEALLAEDGARLQQFGDLLLAVIASGTRVVLALRADFFGLLASHSGLARRVGPATVLVGPPDEQELRRIVTEPAARVGLRVDPALADLVVTEVKDRPGVLPVLSTALVRTWEHREGDLLSVASYRAGGGVEAALQRVGEDAWAALADDEQRAACRRMLLRLAVNEDGSWVRRWARRAEVAGPGDAAAEAALGVLTDRRLVVARADDVGVTHEALLTGWPRLRGWLEDGAAHAAVRERLAVAAAEWQEHDRDPAELYAGTRLQAALDTAAQTPDDLTPLERTFLADATDQADRRLAEQQARAEREARGRRRARLTAAGLAVALAFAGSAGTYAVIQQRQAQQAADVADAGRLGALARTGGGYDQALLLAAQAMALNPSPQSQSDLLATLLRGDQVQSVFRAPDPVVSTAFTPDGRSVYAFTAAGRLLGWPASGTGPSTSSVPGPFGAQVQITADGRPVVALFNDHGDPVTGVADPATGQIVDQAPVVDIGDWTLSGDRQVLVGGVTVGPDDDPRRKAVVLWRVGSPAGTARTVRLPGFPAGMVACGAQTVCVALHPAPFGPPSSMARIRIADGTLSGSITFPPDNTGDFVVSPDGRLLATVMGDGSVRLLDATTGREVSRLDGGTVHDPHLLGFSPDGTRLAGADQATILVWGTAPDADPLPVRYGGHSGPISTGAWSPDGTTLATAGNDGTVILSDTTGRRRLGRVVTDQLGGNAFTVWATGRQVVVGQERGRLLFVDPATGRIEVGRGAPPGTDAYVTARTGRGDTGRIVTTDQFGHTAVWDLKGHRVLGPVRIPVNKDPDALPYLPAVWVSPDGRLAATIRREAGPIIFDVATRTVVRQLPPLPPPVATFNDSIQGWSADGKSLLISRQLTRTHCDLLLVDATTGAVKLTVPTGAAWAGEATADPAGRFLALALTDGTLLLVDPKDGHHLAPPLRAVDGSTFNLSVSPNGRYISVSGSPPQVTVWDTRTYRQVGTPLPVDADAPDARARFAGDGQLIVVTGPVMRSFTMDPAQWLARACREAGRTLTRAEFEQFLPGRRYAPACRNG